MPNAIREATRIQIGKETTSGTTVAATRRLIGAGTTVTLDEPMAQFEDHVSGTLVRTARSPMVTRNRFAFQYKAPFSFEEVLLALLGGVLGTVTPVATGSEQVWTFAPSVSTVPSQNTYTIEYVEDDLAGNAYEVESGFSFVESFEITGGVEGVAQLTINMAGRKYVVSTATPALAVPTLNEAPNLLWSHFMDNTHAGLGGTQITGQILEFTYRFHTGLTDRYYQDGRATLDFSQVQPGKRWSELTMTCAINPASGGFVRSELANKENAVLRHHRLQIQGPVITSNPYQLQIDGAYYHQADSVANRGTDANGVMTTTMHLMSALDPVSSFDVGFAVRNILASFG